MANAIPSGSFAINNQKNTISGTVTLKTADGRTTVAALTASGAVAQQAAAQTITTANSVDGSSFTVSVTWATDDAATGSAAGTYGGTSYTCNLAVSVGHGGKRHGQADA